MRDREKRFFAIVCMLIFVVCIATMTLACTERITLPDVSPVSWDVYLAQAVNKITDSVKLNGNRINITFTADFARDLKSYRLFAGMNYDIASPDDSVLVIELKDDERTLMSVKCDNSDAYIDIVPNDYVGDAKLIVTDMTVFDWLGVKYNPDNEDALAKALDDILFKLGKGLFDEVNVNAEQTVYSFDFAPDCFRRGISYFEAVFEALGESFKSVFLKAVRAESIADFFGGLPAVEGKAVFDFTSSGGVVISSEDLTSDGVATSVSLALKAQYAFDETLKDSFPADTAGYVSLKLGNTHVSGTVSLNDHGSSAIRYDFELNSDIDLMTLILNDYDLSSLGDDNYFHLRLKHACSERCGDFCAEKFESASGAVLDVGFSPRDFGTSDLYVSLCVGSFVSSAYADELSDYTGTSFSLFLPDYVLFALPGEMLTSGSARRILSDLFRPDRLFNSGETVITVSDGIPDILTGLTDTGAGFVRRFFRGENYDVDEIIVNVNENRFGEAVAYDVYKQTVYIIDDTVPEVKDYGTDMPILGYKYVAPISWEYESAKRVSVGSFALNNIYDGDGNLIHGVDSAGNYVPMSPEEAEGLTSMYLKATYLKYDKVTVEAFDAKITEVIGLDPASTEVQEVTLKAEFPGPFHSGGAEALFADLRSAYVMSVKAKIKLTPMSAEGISFEQDAAGEKYYLTRSERTPPSFLTADVTVGYEGGKSKSLRITGESDAVIVTDNIFSVYYSVVRTGGISVRFDVAGKTFVRSYRVEEPDEAVFSVDTAKIGPFNVGKSVYLSSITPYVKLTARYNLSGGVKEVDVLLASEDFYVNGISLDKNSSDWTSRAVGDSGSCVLTFNKANKYFCHVEKFGYKSDTFVIPVLQAAVNEPAYAYRQTSVTPADWFAGVDYSISGNIVNSLHGETPNGQSTYNIEIQILKGVITDNSATGGSSYIRYECVASYDEAGHALFSSESDPAPYAGIYMLRFGGNAVAGNRTDATVPDMITSPVALNFTFRFFSEGYYRIRLTARSEGLNTISRTWDVYVNSL